MSIERRYNLHGDARSALTTFRGIFQTYAYLVFSSYDLQCNINSEGLSVVINIAAGLAPLNVKILVRVGR